MKAKNLDKDILTNLYVSKRLTSYEISEILNVSRVTVIRYLKKFNIDINPKQRKYELIKKIPFTKEQKEFLVGTLLGDGCIAPTGRKNKSYHFLVGHCEKQKDLLMWKKIVLGNFVNVINKRIDKRGNSIMYNFSSITHNEFRFFYNLFYQNGKKIIRDELINYVTPFSLAVWIMDDGSLNKGVNLRLSTDGFSKEDNEKLQYILKVNFDIRSKVCTYQRNNKAYYFISLNKENTIKASKLTEKYFVDCMKYKLYRSSTTNMPNVNIIDDDRV